MIKILFVGVLFPFLTLTTNAAESKSAPVTADQFRCEKLAGMTLAEFKMKLVENCNLEKPFSSSLSRLLNEETYMYCCQKK